PHDPNHADAGAEEFRDPVNHGVRDVARANDFDDEFGSDRPGVLTRDATVSRPSLERNISGVGFPLRSIRSEAEKHFVDGLTEIAVPTGVVEFFRDAKAEE